MEEEESKWKTKSTNQKPIFLFNCSKAGHISHECRGGRQNNEEEETEMEEAEDWP